jgi:hypothetical protein
MTLLSILLVLKTGEVNVANIKEFAEEDLYKRAGFKSSTDFQLRTIFRSDAKNVHVYGKITGRAGQENKYDFPPPIDKTLFFGTVVLVAKVGDVATSLSLEEWETMYDAFMGGFEDLGTDDTDDTTEEDELPGVQKTRDGYLKDDGFVVDDDDDDDDKEEPKIKPTKKRATKQPQVDHVFASATEALLLDCSHELSEEEYET